MKRTLVPLKAKTYEDKIRAQRKSKARPFAPVAIQAENPLDRNALHAALVPFVTTVLRRWQSEGRVKIVNGKMVINRINRNHKKPAN